MVKLTGMIDDRQFLTRSIVFVGVVFSIMTLLELFFAGYRDHFFLEVLVFILAFITALLMLAIMIDAIGEIIVQRHYAWLLAIAMLSVAGAYLYGYLVATRKDSS